MKRKRKAEKPGQSDNPRATDGAGSPAEPVVDGQLVPVEPDKKRPMDMYAGVRITPLVEKTAWHFFAGGARSLGEAMRRAGYAATTANNPHLVHISVDLLEYVYNKMSKRNPDIAPSQKELYRKSRAVADEILSDPDISPSVRAPLAVSQQKLSLDAGIDEADQHDFDLAASWRRMLRPTLHMARLLLWRAERDGVPAAICRLDEMTAKLDEKYPPRPRHRQPANPPPRHRRFE